MRRNIHIGPLLKLGATLVVNSEEKNYSNKILAFTKNKQPTIGVEAIGGAEGAKLIQLLAPNSQAILYGTLSLSHFPNAIFQYTKEKNILLSQFHLREWIHGENLAKRKNTIASGTRISAV